MQLPTLGEVTLEAHDSLAAAEHEWRAFESRAAGHCYQRFQWLSAWNVHIRPAALQPFIVVLRHRGRTQMLLPLAIERTLGLSRLVPIGAPVCDYHCPLIDPDFAALMTPDITAGIVREVSALAGVDYLVLTHVPPMLGDTRNPFTALRLHPFSANAYAARLGNDWQEYYASRRSGRTRSRLRRKEHSLERVGPVEFRVVTDPDQRGALAAEMVRLKADHLKQTAGAFNALARPDVQAFFHALACDRAHEDVFLFELRAGGMFVAAALGVVGNGSFYYQLSAYADEAFRRFSPGYLLLTRVMEWAVAQGCTRFDFTVGDEAYKSEWSDETWPLGCGAWARTLPGRFGAFMAVAALVLTRHVKRHPALFAIAVRCRTAIGRIRQALRPGPG